MWCLKLVILLEIVKVFDKNWHCIDHKGIRYATRGSSDHPYTSKETLKQQWMSVLTAECLISWADLVPEIAYFA